MRFYWLRQIPRLPKPAQGPRQNPNSPHQSHRGDSMAVLDKPNHRGSAEVTNLDLGGDKPETWEDQWKCFKMTFYHTLTIQTPMCLAVYIYIEYVDLPCDWNSMPRWYSAVLQIFGCFVIEDTWEYFTHRLLHHKTLYPYLHKVHHNFQAPFSIQATYVSHAETVIIGTGFFFGMLAFCHHLFLLWLWVVARVAQNTHVHSGYDVPWDPLRLVPFAATARYHDFHHLNGQGNYASIFTWWDELFGTDKEYENYNARGRQKEMKEDDN
uniref:Fatty acid hydroxylase domain-containing protein n=1 Tax=Crocodylus porosus TaxID=8502 RepID=A0A7M4EY32_CROPO